MKYIYMVFVLLLFPFQSVVVQAETGDTAETIRKIADYKEYDSFMKRYHEHWADLTYFVGMSYDSNEHYFRENMQAYRDKVNEIYGDDSYRAKFLNAYFAANEFVGAKPIAFLSVFSDLKNELFEKIKGAFTTKDVNHELTNYFMNTSSYTAWVKTGYKLKVGERISINGTNGTNDIKGIKVQTPYNLDGDEKSKLYLSSCYGTATEACVHEMILDFSNLPLAERNKLINEIKVNPPLNDFFYTLVKYFPGHPPISIIQLSDSTEHDVYLENTPQPIDDIVEKVVNNFNYDNRIYNQDYVPNVVPLLVCPNESIELDYQNNSFYTKEMTRNLVPVEINSNGVATYNNETCNLDFKFPVIDINLDGVVTADGVSLVSSAGGEVVPIDNGLIAYIRNSYTYATSLVSTGVQGLNSIISGTTGLIAFTGSLFGFLPPEIMVLFIGGFSVALGLWVFKK